MRFPKAPDLSTPPRMAFLAAVVAAVVSAILTAQWWGELDVSLGDTDDAMRLVLVRSLLHGRGWFDQHLMRLQPPVGVYMHWSQLLTGAIAAVDWLFQRVLSEENAEFATRLLWPLAWILPAAFAALLLARQHGRGLMNHGAVLVAALILVTDSALFVQFRPGRIDHHDVQMALCLLSLVGASLPAPNRRGALLAGIATGIGIAVGLEALVFEAAIGAAFAVRFALWPEKERAAAIAYGLSLALTTAVAFAVQTPPWRWGLAACDAAAVNSVAAVAVAGVGLALIARFTAAADPRVRVAALAVLAMAAAGVYLGLDPNCAHGPFADVDPRIKPIWLNYVQEVRPIGRVLKHDKAAAITAIATWTLGAIAWIGLGFRAERRRDPAYWLGGAVLAVGVAAGASAIRMSGYAEWFAVPLIAAGAVELARRYPEGGVVTLVLAAAVATPSAASGLALLVSGQGKVPLFHVRSAAPPKRPPRAKLAKPAKPAPDECFDTDSFDELDDASPPGLVLSEVDMAPFILANTDHSALSGPYHRMSWGILKARSILQAPADGAAATLARQAGVAYVLECRAHWKHGDHDGMNAASLSKRLDAGKPPAWLEPLSPKDAPLQAYRVLPAVSVPVKTPDNTASPAKAGVQVKSAGARS